MAEKAIHLHTDMVDALIKRRKTQYRFAIKHNKNSDISVVENQVVEKPSQFNSETALRTLICPMGNIGDTLWVKEPWRAFISHKCDSNSDSCHCSDIVVAYLVDNEKLFISEWDLPENTKIKSPSNNKGFNFAVTMPKWASRIQLKITDIRAEKLWDISEADAIAEGVEPILWKDGQTRYPNYLARHKNHKIKSENHTPQSSYFTFIESTMGRKFFESNPWVWVVEFKIIKSKIT